MPLLLHRPGQFIPVTVEAADAMMFALVRSFVLP